MVLLINGNGHRMDNVLVRCLTGSLNKTGLVEVFDPDGKHVPAQFVHVFSLNDPDADRYELQFSASVGPLGFAQYTISVKNDSMESSQLKINTEDTSIMKTVEQTGSKDHWLRYLKQRLMDILKQFTLYEQEPETPPIYYEEEPANHTSGTVNIENESIQLTFNASTGLLSSYKSLSSGEQYALSQHFAFYIGAGGSPQSGQVSGAYIFRPDTSAPMPQPLEKAHIEVLRSPLVTEVRQVFNEWVSQVIRLYANTTFVEFDWMVGPLPKDSNGQQKTHEVVTRYTVSGLNSNGEFFTDANGRQMVRRIRNDPSFFGDVERREPVPGNYYPVTTAIFVRDENTQLTVLTDRSQGGTSLADGQIELMLHRRAFWDDGLGVEEALDEPGPDGRGLIIVRGRHRLLLESRRHGSGSQFRQQALKLLHEPAVMNIDSGAENSLPKDLSGLNDELPGNINLLSLRQLNEKHRNKSEIIFLVRLEHMFQRDEDPILSQPTTINLNNLFRDFTVQNVELLNLAGTGPVEPRYRPKLEGMELTLKPQQIATLRLRVLPGHRQTVPIFPINILTDGLPSNKVILLLIVLLSVTLCALVLVSGCVLKGVKLIRYEFHNYLRFN